MGQKAPPDPLIEPSLLEIAALYQSGKLASKVPPELVPFLESPTRLKLEEVLRANPELFWHPRMKRQFQHLKDFSVPVVADGIVTFGLPHGPARGALRALVQAWVHGLLGSDWKPKGRRGRKATPMALKLWLLGHYRELLDLLKRHDVRRAKGQSEQQWVTRLCRTIQKVWTQSLVSPTIMLTKPVEVKPTKRLTELLKAYLKGMPTNLPKRIKRPKTVPLPADEVKKWAEVAVRKSAEGAIRDRLAYSILGHDWNLGPDQVRGRIQAARKHLRATMR